MVDLALLLGAYAYVVFALGLLGQLYRLPVFLVTLVFSVGGIYWLWKHTRFNCSNWIKEIKKDNLVKLLLGILLVQIFINFLGALSPELSFDALWYHLPAARLYTENHRIFFIPGTLLWPANVPHLADIFYSVAFLFSGDVFARLIHLSFGVLSLVALYQLLRRYLSLRMSLLGAVTFYTMLIVGWQSTTAYIELARTFFEILALDLFLKWYETKKENFLWESAIMVGLAISTKILAFGTLGALGILILLLRRKNWLKLLIVFTGLAILVVSPWLIFSAVHTGNPLFPMSGIFHEPSFNVGGPSGTWLAESISKLPLLLWNATLKPDDIISPIYLIFLPLVLIYIWKENGSIKIAGLYFLLNVFLAPAQSNRYLLPYLPAFTLVVFKIVESILVKKSKYQELFFVLILFCALLNLGSRGLASKKFLPYLLGQESKGEFLSKRLNFSYGDFYDVDGWFAKNINKNDLVLVYDIHNLYYLDFPFVHESWARSGTYFTHILVGDNKQLPKKFGDRLLVYHNKTTGVKVYVYGEKYQ